MSEAQLMIHVTDREGRLHHLEAVEGWRVMEIIREHGLPLKAECGGALECATCHVYVQPWWLSKLVAKRPEEDIKLDEAFHVKPNSRLCCQIIMSEALDGLELILAPESQ